MVFFNCRSNTFDIYVCMRYEAENYLLLCYGFDTTGVYIHASNLKHFRIIDKKTSYKA